MEIKTSKIKEIVSVKPYTNSYGTTHYHLLVMENGDKINIGKKKELQAGWEITYEIIEEGQQEYNKAKSAQQEFKPKKNNSNNSVSSFALSYAKDWCLGIHNAGEPQTTENVLAAADVFNDWLKNNQ